jgi:HTH-type transcriptional regulator / antitoxin HipB
MSQFARSPRQLGNIIQRVRKQRGLTQTELANLAGLRQEMVSKIETGHGSTKLSALYSLFSALGLDMLVENRSAQPGKAIEDIF